MFVRWPRLRMMWDLLFASSRLRAQWRDISAFRVTGTKARACIPYLYLSRAPICRMAAGQDRSAALESATRVRDLRAVLCELDSWVLDCWCSRLASAETLLVSFAHIIATEGRIRPNNPISPRAHDALQEQHGR